MPGRPIRKPFAGLVLLALLGGGCSRAGTPEGQAATLPLSRCHLGAPGTGLRVAARCGTLAVPEDPAQPEGRQVDLRLAVVPARNQGPEPDPLVLLAGGPGQAATETYASMEDAFASVRRERDIVLVDQRGTGGSNRLACPEADPLAELGEIDEARAAADAAACRDALSGRADLRQYTTARSVDDLAAALDALGYGRVNLYGISYGTRVAQAFLRRHPERVRSVVLDGVAPVDEPLGRDLAADAQRALDGLVARCERDADCRKAYPDLAATLAGARAGWEAAPREVALADPVSGQPRELTLPGVALAQTLRLLSYAPETAALLPLFLTRSAKAGDDKPLAAAALLLTRQLGDSLAGGMANSVLCSEDAPFLDLDAARQQSAGTLLGDLPARLMVAGCREWPRGEVAPEDRSLLRSDVPALLLSGELDPVTPPDDAERVAEGLPNGRHVVAPGQGHGVVGRGCLPRVLADFIAAGTAEGLDVACVDRLGASPAYLDFAGTAP
jgi:pimeloyl-ACP methyl ester carboxylesterase